MTRPRLFEHVALTQDKPELRLKKGDVAVVVDFAPHPSGGEEGCVLEIFNAIGDSIATAAVPLSHVEPLTQDEVLAIRRLEKAV